MLVCRGCRRFVHAEDAACPFCGVGSASAAAPLVMAIALGVALGACGPNVGVDDGSTGGTGTTTTAGSVTASSATAPAPDTGDVPPNPSVATSVSETATDTADVTSSSEDGVSGDEGCAFYGGCPTDWGGDDFQCDIWAQDCAKGEKCMPWANDGGDEWNATRCSPLAPNAGAPGDPCTVEGNAYSGIDDCDVGSMCWNVDPNTNEGVCVANCFGNEANPLCPGDEWSACVMGYGGTINLCLPGCDPLVQDCGVGSECIPYEDGFVCVPDRSGDEGQAGDDCDRPDRCDPGLWCAAPEQVPGCVGLGCCTEFCDLDQPEPDTQCTAGDGVTCLPWFEGDPPPGWGANLGTCALPL